MTQAEVQAKGARAGGACARAAVPADLRPESAVIGNEGRTPERMACDTSQWTVFVTNHDKAFGSSDAFPAYLQAAHAPPGAWSSDGDSNTPRCRQGGRRIGLVAVGPRAARVAGTA